MLNPYSNFCSPYGLGGVRQTCFTCQIYPYKIANVLKMFLTIDLIRNYNFIEDVFVMRRCAGCKWAAGCGPSMRTNASTRVASSTLHTPSSTWSPSLTAPLLINYIPRSSLYVTFIYFLYLQNFDYFYDVKSTSLKVLLHNRIYQCLSWRFFT